MNSSTKTLPAAALALLCALPALAQAKRMGTPAKLDGARIEQLTGLKGKWDEKEGVFKVTMPRADLAPTSGGVKITPPLGLTAWAAFQGAGGNVMVMGDLVLAEDQVVPAMDAALGNGLEVTALHNHFLGESPRVMFMHIGGMGNETALATAVGKVFATIKETEGGKGKLPQGDIDPAAGSIDATALDAIFGKPGEASSGVVKYTFGRTTRMHGQVVGNAMGVNTWAAFAGSADRAVVDGDFAMREDELQPVLKALRGAGIAIVAIHQHMAGETPRILFLHFWGIGRAADLANGVKAALGKTAL